MTSRLKCAAVAVLCVGLSGCLFPGRRKPHPIQTPLPPPPAEVKPPPPKVEPLPGPAPKIETKAPDVPASVTSIPKPPAPKPKRKPKRQAPQAAPPPPAPEETATPAPATATIPKLGEILTEEQKSQYQKMCDESLNRARGSLAMLRGYKLSADQKQSVQRINAFIVQARQARESDPLTARQLAERADVLSRDLVKSVR